MPLKLEDGGAEKAASSRESAQDERGLARVIENIVPGAVGFTESVASILEELGAATTGATVAAERTSLCPGAECGPALGATGWGATFLIVVICILTVAATRVVPAGRRRRKADLAHR